MVSDTKEIMMLLVGSIALVLVIGLLFSAVQTPPSIGR
jgi:hypothetical protein